MSAIHSNIVYVFTLLHYKAYILRIYNNNFRTTLVTIMVIKQSMIYI